ncbi:hypothetical protein N5U14_03160 [Aliarcobacter butzleri]|nr:hypothetical protein [Aliarcobacter butzleri]
MNELYIKGRPLNQQQFINLINVKIIIGKNFINPSRKGTTIIKNNDGSKITYQRKKSNISIEIQQLWDTYQKFLGNIVSSTDLKQYRPDIYDSNKSGHSCNYTTLFLILQDIGIINSINGNGVRGNPFWIQL